MINQERKLTGLYDCDDEMRYYIQQNGNTIWWYGEEISDDGSWPHNVARGEIIGNTIIVSWSIVPPNDGFGNPFLEGPKAKESKSHGILILNIESLYPNAPYKLKAKEKIVEFAGSEWNQMTLDWHGRRRCIK
jgi:hypothetical protein